jgi:predicted transcriptional regulator
VEAIAKDKNPAEVKAGDLIEEAHVWWIDADADIDEVLRQMAEHKIRLLPVLENRELVGIISQADLATELLELMETVFRSFAVAVKEAVRPTGYHEHNRREVKP